MMKNLKIWYNSYLIFKGRSPKKLEHFSNHPLSSETVLYIIYCSYECGTEWHKFIVWLFDLLQKKKFMKNSFSKLAWFLCEHVIIFKDSLISLNLILSLKKTTTYICILYFVVHPFRNLKFKIRYYCFKAVGIKSFPH